MDSGLLILNLGYSLMFIALAIHEILWLRCTLTFAQATLFIYNIFISSNYNIAFWMCVFIIVNTIQIVRIINERRPRLIPDELKDLYDGIFTELTSKEFLYFWNMGTLKEISNDYFIYTNVTGKQLIYNKKDATLLNDINPEIDKMIKLNEGYYHISKYLRYHNE